MSATHILFLRGVTPVGKNKVPMAPLRVALERAGFRDVGTYIQSGNVLVTSKMSHAKLEKLTHEVIKKKFGGDITVVAKTLDELREILKRTPFSGADSSKLYFTMLASQPEVDLQKKFLDIDFSPDKVKIVGNVVYTLYATKHSDSKFNNNVYERKLKVAATTRNYNTMTKLIKLGSESDTGD